MATAPVLRGHLQLVKAYVSVLGLNDSGFKSRKYTRDKINLK